MKMGIWGRKPKIAEAEPVEVQPEEQQAEEIPSLPSPLTSTVVATGVTVSGTMEGEGVIRVEGVVSGEIRLQGAVIVTTTGRIEGPVTADVIEIAGNVEGNCVARDHMCLEKTGSLEGDVTTGSLIVHDGGRLNGRSNMVREEKKTERGSSKHKRQQQSGDLQFGPNYKAEEEDGG